MCRSLPRVGIRFAIPKQYSKVTWYGQGPHECYPDRQFSAALRQHSMDDVHSMHVPYVFPSESGGRCGVRWLALEDASRGTGIAAEAVQHGGQHLQINVSRHSLESFESAKHDYELKVNNIPQHCCLQTNLAYI